MCYGSWKDVGYLCFGPGKAVDCRRCGSCKDAGYVSCVPLYIVRQRFLMLVLDIMLELS